MFACLPLLEHWSFEQSSQLVAAADALPSMSTAEEHQARLVVKHTFLDVEEAATPCRRFGLLRRARTESALEVAKYSEEYQPGSLVADDADADNAAMAARDTEEAHEEEPGPSAAEGEPHERLQLPSGRLVVKHTFLTFVEDDLSPASPSMGVPRSKTEPWINVPEDTWADDSTQDDAPEDATACGAETELSSIDSGASSKPSSPASSAGVSGTHFLESEEADARTTVMLRHLPNNYSRAMFLEMLDEAGFAHKYDFVYLPIDFNRRAGYGYAFVNLVDPSVVPEFWKVFDGFRNWVLPTAKICEVSWSDPLQGLEAHIERYRNSPVMHRSVPDEYRPMIFEKGVRVNFPKATKSLRPPFRRN